MTAHFFETMFSPNAPAFGSVSLTPVSIWYWSAPPPWYRYFVIFLIFLKLYSPINHWHIMMEPIIATLDALVSKSLSQCMKNKPIEVQNPLSRNRITLPLRQTIQLQPLSIGWRLESDRTIILIVLWGILFKLTHIYHVCIPTTFRCFYSLILKVVS